MQERGFEHQSVPVHYLELGPAGGPAVLLLHGSGAGASTLGNFRKVLQPLADAGLHVFAMDLIGFGRSGRKRTAPYFDYPLWLDQCRQMLRHLPGQRVGVIGHSLSGSLALRLAASEPRVGRVMTTASLGAPFQANATTLATWTCPRNREQLLSAAQRLIADHTLIDEAYLEQRAQLLFSGDYADHYDAMFAGDRQRFIDIATLAPEELAAIGQPVLMLHGMADPGYPAEPLSLSLARSLPRADVMLLGGCSHSVAFERPQTFIDAATAFFKRESAP